MTILMRILGALWSGLRSKRFLHLVGSLLVLAIFLGAAWLLAGELQHYTLREIADHIRNTPASSLVWAVVLAVLSYIVLVGYDLIAVRFVGLDLPLWKVALASFVSYAFSYNFGATMAGTSVRYRLYAGWKVPPLKIVELLLILGLTFWFGLFFFGGVLFTTNPLHVPPQLIEELQAKNAVWQRLAHVLTSNFHAVGIALLLIAAIYVTLSAVFRGEIRFYGRTIPVPPLRLTLYQYAIASADFVIAAGVLYALLPPLPGSGFATVMGVYVLAYVAEVLTHVPGGWGVFELPLIYLLPADRGQLIAAVLLFRVIYRLVPVLVGAVLLGVNELLLRREGLQQLSGLMLGRRTPAGDGQEPEA